MKPNVIAALLASRKSVVGMGALVLIGLVYFFGPGGWPEKSVVVTTIAGVAVSIITAIGREDAAAKGAAGAIAAAAATPPAQAADVAVDVTVGS